MGQMTRTERLLRLARLRGDRAAELILATNQSRTWEMRIERDGRVRLVAEWTETEKRAAWGDR